MTNFAGASESATEQKLNNVLQPNTVVLDALAAFEQNGHAFAYSHSRVHRRLRFKEIIAAPSPIEQLKLSLEVVGLTLEVRDPNDWLIVPYRTDSPVPEPVTVVQPEATKPRLEEVLVTSSRYKLKNSIRDQQMLHTLRDNELNALPEIGDDALRAALHLPGMATVGVSAKPYVRGGSQDETLVLFDSVELFEPYHLRDFQSVFSTLNPALIESIDVYTGGFPARYGDRMSAVVDIKPIKDHSQVGGELGLSTLTTSAALFGPLGEGRGDWSISARRGNLDWLTEQVNRRAGEPSYSDWYGQFSYALSPRTELTGTLVGYEDDVVLSDGEPGDGEDAESRYHNVYGWLQLSHDLSAALSNTLTVTATTIRHHRSGTISDEDIADSNAEVLDRRDFNIYSVQNLLNYQRDESFGWEVGARFSYQNGSYRYQSNVVRGELAELLDTQPILSRNIRAEPSGNSGAVFASTFIRPLPALSVETGLRYDFQNFGEEREQQLSPRLSIRYEFSANTNVRFSAGRFFQAEGIHELNVPDGMVEYQSPQRADHYIAALSHEFGDTGLSLRSELFYKRFRDVKVRHENLFNPFVMLPELAADRVTIAPDKARAQGLELSIGYNRDDRLISWASYTLAKAEDYVDGRWELRSWDQRHTLSAGFIWRPKQWEISAAVLAHSGWPTSIVPSTVAEDELLEVRRNQDRLSDYISLDVRVARRWERGRHTLMLFAEITNILDRDNVGSVEIDIEEDEENETLSIFTTEESVFPWIPSVGIQWTF
ncbi:MAG: TonB-dependent receptor plug domain-containing protein [Pseudomonadales bacterium]